jgi:L-arabonate dehydrase
MSASRADGTKLPLRSRGSFARRRADWTPLPAPERGWAKLYVDHVLQAHEGADLDFLVGCSGAAVPRESH